MRSQGRPPPPRGCHRQVCEVPVAGSALKGAFECLRGLRVGRYRIVYEWQQQELVVLVVRVGHRKEVYR